ncbi:MAG: hypothetical protein P8Q48_24125 [Paracoccaceae bacterium]|nr:hypothetical protein [Paracoccaceae bacterium]
MGEANFGAPINEVEWIKTHLDLDVFIEGGTYKGHTASRMAIVFERVFTIERHDQLHKEARARHPIGNITFLHGDTRDHLPHLLQNHRKCLIWLDAHWSGLGTHGEDDECPLLDELALIFASPAQPAILIDDARLFTAPPPPPHKLSAWPSLDQVLAAIPDGYRTLIIEDVIYVLASNTFPRFREYIRNQPSV